MPQKKNPSTLELIRGKSAEVYGCLTELLTMVKGVNSGYYQDLQQTKIPLWRCLDTTLTSLEVMTGIVSTLVVYREKMRERLEGSFVIGVELAEVMVMEAHLSFREAYKVVAYLVKNAVAEGKTLSDLTPADVSDASLKELGREVRVDEGLIVKAIDPEACIMRRKSLGSPHPSQAKTMLENRRKQLTEYINELQEREGKATEAMARLRKSVEDYASF